MFPRMSLAFISPLGKVVSLKYAHETGSDPFNDENALKTNKSPDFCPWDLVSYSLIT